MKPELILDFPRFGLCNKLITWAKALVWCEKNNVHLVVRGWTHLPFGSILRGDKSWRWYQGFFMGNKPLAGLFSVKKPVVITGITDPVVKGVSSYHFKATPYISDLPLLRDYHSLIKQEFFKMIHPRHRKLADTFSPPKVGIHIRQGDFAKIGASVKLDYFLNIIDSLKSILGYEVKVTIFSDGHSEDLGPVLSLPKVHLFHTVNDLVDLLVFSSSRILVTSKGSSYSYWAAFISEGIVIHHPTTWVPQCRPASVNSRLFEGPLEKDGSFPAALVKQLVDLRIELK